MNSKKFTKIFYNVFTGFIILLAVLILFSLFPITGNYKILIVQSGSMEPAIHTGSIVVTKPEAHYQVGDIITFGTISKTKAPTTHRIYSIDNGKYITKGDANEDPDMSPITANKIIGKVLFSVPYIGYLIDFARRPLGFMLIIGLPALLLISDEIKKIIQQIKKMKSEGNKDSSPKEEKEEQK